MQKLFILVLSVAAFVAFSGPSAAQGKRLLDKASPQLSTGKVTQADERTKMVTILGTDGAKVTLNFSDPKIGACKGGRKSSLSELQRFPKMGDNMQIARYSCQECLQTC
jgi:hypothetical protein